MFQVSPSVAAEIATSRLKRSTLASTSRISIIPSHSWFLCVLMAGHFKKICTGVYRYFWSHFPQTAGWLNLGMVINFAEYRTHDFPLTRCFASLKSTVYPKKYAHDFCFAVLCCGYTLTDFPISIRLTSLVLGTTKPFRPNARDPPRTRLNTTTSQFSLPSTGDPCIIHKKKNGPVESECKLNNVNPHIIRN